MAGNKLTFGGDSCDDDRLRFGTVVGLNRVSMSSVVSASPMSIGTVMGLNRVSMSSVLSAPPMSMSSNSSKTSVSSPVKDNQGMLISDIMLIMRLAV